MRTAIILFLLLTLILKVVFVGLRGPVAIELDAAEYWRLSELAMRGDVLFFQDPIAYRTPIYPWFLAAIRLAFGTAALPAIVVIQSLLSVGSILIAAKIATNITQSPNAMPLTLMFSFPLLSSFTFNGTVLTEPLFIFLMMCSLLTVDNYAMRRSTVNAMLAGIAFAVTFLTRPVIMLLWVAHLMLVGLVYLRTRNADNPPPKLTHLVLASVVCIAVCIPWLWRNDQLFDKAMITEFVGRNLWTVTFQDGSGADLELPDTSAGRDLRQRLVQADVLDQSDHNWAVSAALVESGLNDPEADRLMKQVSIDAIKQDVPCFLYQTVRRFANLWRTAATDLPLQGKPGEYKGEVTWRWNVTAVEWLLEHRASQSVFVNTFVMVAVGLSTAYLIVRRSTRHYGVWLAAIFCYFTAITGMLEIPTYRYRIVFEPLICATLASAVIMYIGNKGELRMDESAL